MRILLIDIDTLRPDHLGCYGYHRETSPNIDAIAAEGVRFEHYHSSDAPCQPARAALMTGQFGIRNGVVGHGGTVADLRLEGRTRGFRAQLDHSSLFSMLQNAGLYTCAITPFAKRHAFWSFLAGFNEVHDTFGNGGMELAHEVTPIVIDWLERNQERENWFLHVNLWDPHAPYRTPEDVAHLFEDDPIPEWLDSDELIAKHRQKTGPHAAQELNMYDNKVHEEYPQQPGEIKNREDMRKVINGYDRGIRHADNHVGQIVDYLKKKGLWEDTVVIITSDHGENFGELGIYCEHGTADEITTRVPMIVRWPGKQTGHVDQGLHYHLDLVPTLAEMLGVEPHESWSGRSYAASVNEGADTGREYLVLGQCAHVCQRAVRWENWLYIRTYHDGHQLFPREMLFDLANDPHEQHDVAVEHPDLCRQGAWYLADWHDEQMALLPDAIDPQWTCIREGGPFHAKGRLPEYVQRLEQTGRGHDVPELRRRHPYEFESQSPPFPVKLPLPRYSGES